MYKKIIIFSGILLFISCVSKKSYVDLDHRLKQSFDTNIEILSDNARLRSENDKLLLINSQLNKSLNEQSKSLETQMADQSALVRYQRLDLDYSNGSFDFQTKNTKISHEKLGLPKNFLNADELIQNHGIGDDLEKIMGNIVKLTDTVGNVFKYRDLGRKYLISNSKIKMILPTDPFIYENKFNNVIDGGLGFILGNLSTKKEDAFSYEIINLGEISISQNEIDIKALRESTAHLSKEEKNNLYLIIGATNYATRTTIFSENDLRGSFEYAFQINGKKYTRTSSKSLNKKIAINVVAINDFLMLN